MSSIDINIVNRNVGDNFNWTAVYGELKSSDLDKVGEQQTDNGGALNSLPTPFARFFVVKEAFRRVLEEEQNNTKKAGEAYERLVSDTLDVFELLYNAEFHKADWGRQGRKLVVKEWNYTQNLPGLNSAPKLKNAIEKYYASDITDKTLFFVILEDNGKELLLACSSPRTGFVTPPDLDWKGGTFAGSLYKNLDLSRRWEGRYFDGKPLLFGQRNEEFRNYMYKLFSGANVDSRYKEIQEYIRHFKDTVNQQWQGELKTILSDQGNTLIVNGIAISSSVAATTVDYLSQHLVKLPFKISSDRFLSILLKNAEEDRQYDYLLPLTREGILNLRQGFSLEGQLSTNGDVKVTLTNDGNTYNKTYRTENPSNQEGSIFDLRNGKLNLDVALFPNVLSEDPSQNNHFYVMLSARDSNTLPNFGTDAIALDFYRFDDSGKAKKIDQVETDDYEFGVKPPITRSRQESDSSYGTKYYELLNTAFDLVGGTLDVGKGKRISFALTPKWEKAKTGNKGFTYAIDLGTTSTYISRRENDKTTEPQQLTMNSQIVSFLHAPGGSDQLPLVKRIEEGSPEEFRTAFMTEFVPPLIDGKDYAFPTRTALCISNNEHKLSLFGSSDIAFYYDRHQGAPNQSVKTDIKWSKDENELRTFIRELLLLIKSDILQECGDVAQTKLIWFRPLSFSNALEKRFANLWKEEAKSILNVNTEHITCYTESEAPYYYFSTKAGFTDASSVAVLDIGGGSTDIVFYEDGEPIIANSVHFGCDVLWENGYNKFKNSKGADSNGIFTKYKSNIHFDKDELNKLNDSLIKDEQSSPKDVIEFWISHEKDTKISEKLTRDFAPVFVYHYTALLYYTASMLKAYGHKSPKTLIFSGNGSRYIDGYITSDKEILKTMANKIFTKVFEAESDTQLLLPTERKEATCYGGLYHADGTTSPKASVYLGDGRVDKYDTVNSLRADYGELNPLVKKEVSRMNAIYQDVLKDLTNDEVLENVDIKKDMKIVDNAIDAMDTRYKAKMDEYEDNEPFKDTLFFIPVIEGIFKLTQQ